MKSFAVAAALVGAVVARPQGEAVTSAVSPTESAPSGCQTDFPTKFQIQVNNVTTSKSKREESTPLEITLKNSVLTDAKGRTGYIADNHQFQFDGPAQAGAIYTAGFSVCSNGSLALGDSAIFYQCLSGTFYNLYDDAESEQCSPVYIEVINAGMSASSTSGAASQIADGQVTASPQAVSQISDGQVQATTGAPVTQIADGQIQGPTGTPVSQISDGQIQGPAPTGAPVTQIGDGQIQAPTGSPVTQIGDGQIQAPTAVGTAPVSQISDGQIQAPTNGSAIASATPVAYNPANGASSMTVSGGLFAIFAGLVAVAAL